MVFDNKHWILIVIMLLSLNSFAQPNCSDYTTWTPGMWIGPGAYCGTPYGGTIVTDGSRLYAHKGYCSSTGPGTWDFNDIGACSACTDRTVGAASSTPNVCENTAITTITHATTEVIGISSSSGLPPGVNASYAANTITISGTPSSSGTYNYTITPTSSCGTAVATGTITVNALPTITGSSDASRCNSGTVDISATASTGSIEWFDAASGGSNIGASASGVPWTTADISSTTVYYAEADDGTCASSTRTAVTATINTATSGPGGVTDELHVWLRADQGTGSLGTQWTDQSCNAFAYSTVAGPTIQSTDWNYNPAVEILSGGFDSPDGAELEDQWTIIFVSKLMSSDTNGRLFETNGGNYLWGYHGGYRNGLYMDGSPASHNSGIASANGVMEPHVFTYTRNSSGAIDARVDGNMLANYTSSNSCTGRRIDINQGAWSSQSSDSRVGELIIYKKDLSDSEIQRVESYLAFKYGLTLDNSDGGTDGDLVSSGGTNFWDASADTDYNKGMAMIGKDITGGNTQLQSISTDDSTMLYVAALEVSNASNAGTITNDESFLVAGHNGGVQEATDASLSEMPDSIVSRVEREWKIVNTNFNDDFNMKIEWIVDSEVNLSHLRLLVDDDGDFSDAAIYSADDGLTFSEGSLIIAGISTAMIGMDSTRFITIGSTNIGTPLPVELTNFNANCQPGHISLSWSTLTELNNDFFAIERSENLLNWISIDTIQGSGNSTEILNYSSTAWEISDTYYRLKQVDFNGDYSYSDVISGHCRNNLDEVISVYPNPTSGRFLIKGVNQGKVKVFNSLGQLMYTGEYDGRALHIDVAAGMYILDIETKEAEDNWRAIERTTLPLVIK